MEKHPEMDPHPEVGGTAGGGRAFRVGRGNSRGEGKLAWGGATDGREIGRASCRERV